MITSNPLMLTDTQTGTVVLDRAVVAEHRKALVPPRKRAERDAIYAEFAPLIRRLISQYGRDADSRRDMAGEVYCRFCAVLDAYDPSRGIPLRPYLVRQLTASMYTYARSQWRVREREAAWETDDGRILNEPSEDPTGSWIHAMGREEIASALPAAMQSLPLRQRKVVIWRYFEDRSFDEISDLLKVQPATARSLLRHGINNLRRRMCPAFASAA